MADSDGEALARQLYGNEAVDAFLKEKGKGGGEVTLPSGRTATRPEGPVDYRGVNLEEGAPAWDRFLAGFKSGPEGRLNFYKKRYGEPNVRLSPGGEIEFYKPQTKQWHQVDEKGMSWADLADFGGDIPELLGMVAAPLMRGPQAAKTLTRIATSPGGGAAAGNIGRQMVGKSLPGEDQFSVGDVTKAGIGGELASLGSGPTQALARARINPAGMAEGWLSKRLREAGRTETAQEGRDLVQQTGFPLNLAEITDDPVVKTMLGFAHRSGFGQQLAREEMQAKEDAALAMFGRLLERLGGKEAFQNPSYAAAATQAARESLKSINDKMKGIDYRFLQGPEGELANIPLTNRNAYLKAQADYYRSMRSPEHTPLAEELESLMAKGPANARLVQQLLRESGEEGYGSLPAKEFPRLSALGGTKESRALWQATQQDLKAAAAQKSESGFPSAAERLLEARTKTGELMSQREALKRTPLLAFLESKNMLGDLMKGGKLPAEDAIVPHLLRGMRSGRFTPGEMANMGQLLATTNPEFQSKLAAAAIGDAIKAGFAKNPQRFDFQSAVKGLPDMAYLRALVPDENPISVSHDLQLLMKAIQRHEKFGLGIPQSPGHMGLSMASKLASGEFKSFLKDVVGNILMPRGVARIAGAATEKNKAGQVVQNKFFQALSGGERPKHWLERVADVGIPLGLYEGGSSMQQRNQAGYGSP